MEDLNSIDTELDDEILHTPPKKKDRMKPGILTLIKTQAVVCIIALLAAFVVKFIGGDVYRITRDKYASMFNDYTCVDEVMQTIAHAFDDGTETEPSSAAPEAVSALPSAASLAEDGSSASDEILPANASSEESETGRYSMNIEESMELMHASAESINSMVLPVTGRISDEYGYRIHPITGKLKMHYGIDLAAPYGSDIGAAMSGTVIKVGQSSDYGLYVKLSHGGGLETLYAHCSAAIVSEGDSVAKGQTVAKVGSSGESTGAHCHFEVRVNGTRVNPLWVIKVQTT